MLLDKIHNISNNCSSNLVFSTIHPPKGRRICVVTQPFTEQSVSSQVSDLITILSRFSRLIVITGKFLKYTNTNITIIEIPITDKFN